MRNRTSYGVPASATSIAAQGRTSYGTAPPATASGSRSSYGGLTSTATSPGARASYSPPPESPKIGSLVLKIRQTSANQDLDTSVSTPVSFNTEDFDALGAWASGQPTRFTPPVAGWYLMTGACSFSLNTSGYRGVSWYLNGSHVGGATIYLPAPPNLSANVPARAMPVLLNGTTDYMEMVVIHNAGVTLTTTATGVASYPLMSAMYVGTP